MGIGLEALLREYLKTTLSINTDELRHDTALVTSGIIDSFGLINMIAFVESETGFRTDPTDLKLENFDTLGAIIELVERNQR